MRKNAGFTMLEVMIVIGVVAVVAAIAVPSYLVQLPDIRLRGAVRDLKSDLNLAKQRAIRQNGQVAVVFDVANNQYSLFVDNGAGSGSGGVAEDWIVNGTEEVIKTVAIPDQVTLYAAAFDLGDPRVRFDGRGLPNNSGGAVRMRNSKNKYRGISMTLAGLITTQTSTNGGGSWQDAE